MPQSADDRVLLTGYIDVPNDRISAVKKALVAHIDLTRAEEGCISFDVVQDETRPGRFLVSEVFENQQSFDAHQERTRNSPWFTVTEGIPRHYTITTGADRA